MDSSIVIPFDKLLPFQQYLAQLHLEANKDFLLENPPLWLKYFGAFEILFQLPIFFYAAKALWVGSKSALVVMSIYGFNAFFTTGVCLLYVVTQASKNGLNEAEMWNLFGLYSPYFVIPLVMMIDCASRAMSLIKEQEKYALAKKSD